VVESLLDDRRKSTQQQSRAKTYVLVAAFLSIALHSVWGFRLDVLRHSYRTLITPITKPLLWTRHALKETSESLSEVQRLRKMNRDLKENVGTLRRTIEELEEVKRQHERLSALLDFTRREHRFHFTAAEVVGRPSNPFRRTILVNVGSRDGVMRDDPVIVPEGVVGRVIEVFRERSRVLLLQDMQSSIGAMVQKSRAMGDAMGTGKTHLLIRNIPPEATIDKGDSVITSGMSTFYPKGLAIGTVTIIRKDEGQLIQEILVEPGANASRVEEVLILRRQRLQDQPQAAIPHQKAADAAPRGE